MTFRTNLSVLYGISGGICTLSTLLADDLGTMLAVTPFAAFNWVMAYRYTRPARDRRA